jgi:hypothetical protein
MKLTYRSHSYNLPTPIHLGLAFTDQPKIKSIYRGHARDQTPGPVEFLKGLNQMS